LFKGEEIKVKRGARQIETWLTDARATDNNPVSARKTTHV